MKLYHYVHCPFCVRVRLALGLLELDFESVVLPYDDESTPIKLMNKKMLPIFEWSSDKISNESLDIIKELDTDNLLKNEGTQAEEFKEFESLLNKLGSNVHSLCMPYWIWTPEFNEQSRSYFQNKKEIKRGPFKELIQNKEKYLAPLIHDLQRIEKDLAPFYKSESLTIYDICLASHLWGMYIFPEFQFTQKMHDYLQRVAYQCKFNYHKDFWE